MSTYNIEIREFNGIDYDVLYPLTKIENVIGLNNNLQSINNSIGNLNIGLNSISSSLSDLDDDLGGLAYKDSISLENDVFGALPIANGGTASNNIVQARQNLGLGTLATQNSINLSDSSLTTGSLPVLRGGTGATNALNALKNLGIEISNVEIEEGDPLDTGKIYIYFEGSEDIGCPEDVVCPSDSICPEDVVCSEDSSQG